MAAGDLNGDGAADLAVANYYIADQTVSILLGSGDGSFQPARDYPASSRPVAVALGDVNGDGFLDLALAGEGGVDVRLNNGDGTFGAARSFSAGTRPSSLVTADVNGDGFADLALAIEGSNAAGVLLSNGDGFFQPLRMFAVGAGPNGVAVADVNGDGLPDLATANYTANTVSVLLGNGDGSFQDASHFAAQRGPQSITLGDWNGDGWTDLAVGNARPSAAESGVTVLLNNGDGSFGAARRYSAGTSPFSVASADLNGDGILDLTVVAGAAQVLLGNGDGTFRTSPVSYLAGADPAAVTIADVNADSLPDLAVANYASNDVSILLNDGYWSGPGGAPGGSPSGPSGPRTAPDLFTGQDLVGVSNNPVDPQPAPQAVAATGLPHMRADAVPTDWYGRLVRLAETNSALFLGRAGVGSQEVFDQFFAKLDEHWHAC